jgi:hypothetical protein
MCGFLGRSRKEKFSMSKEPKKALTRCVESQLSPKPWCPEACKIQGLFCFPALIKQPNEVVKLDGFSMSTVMSSSESMVVIKQM